MKKGQSYMFEAIEKFAEDENFGITEHGGSQIGKNFVVLEHESKDIVVSFVLSGAVGGGFIYECVYSDL